nr:protein yae1-like isoform X4 [Ipomoea batatas]
MALSVHEVDENKSWPGLGVILQSNTSPIFSQSPSKQAAVLLQQAVVSTQQPAIPVVHSSGKRHQMDGTIKEELYSEALRFSNLDLGVRPDTNNGNHNAHGECSLLIHLPSESCNVINLIGYRDGLIAGKESSAQEGFNAGFVESVYAGYNWGVVKGVIGLV